MNEQSDLFLANTARPSSSPAQKARQWWPTKWADESMPPGRRAPSDYVVEEDGVLFVGYPKGSDEIDREFYRDPVKVGDVVDFSYVDEFAEIKITMNPDRTYEVIDGTYPDCANAFWVCGDNDTYAHSLDVMVEQWVDNDSPMDGPVTETIEVAYWSENIPHRLVRTADGYAFEQVVPS